jgi:hypothetical protein
MDTSGREGVEALRGTGRGRRGEKMARMGERAAYVARQLAHVLLGDLAADQADVGAHRDRQGHAVELAQARQLLAQGLKGHPRDQGGEAGQAGLAHTATAAASTLGGRRRDAHRKLDVQLGLDEVDDRVRVRALVDAADLGPHNVAPHAREGVERERHVLEAGEDVADLDDVVARTRRGALREVVEELEGAHAEVHCRCPVFYHSFASESRQIEILGGVAVCEEGWRTGISWAL